MSRPCQPASLALLLMLAVTPARAGDCWVATRAKAVTGAGDAITKPIYTRLRGASEAAEQLLRNDARLQAIPGVRFQANRHVTLPARDGGPFTGETWVGLHTSDVWGPGCTLVQGRADYLTPASVSIAFNDPGQLAHALPSEPGVSGFPLSKEAAETLRQRDVIAYNGAGVRLFGPGGRVAIVPVRVGDHLDAWERELKRMGADGAGEFAAAELAKLRDHRAGLSARELDTQAAVSASSYDKAIWGYGRLEDDDALPLFQISPELLLPTTEKGGVYVVVAQYSIANAEAVAEPLLRRWLEALDISPLLPFLAK